MATLFNTKISATYPGLFKTIDNTAITAALKELTDGDGNQSGLYLNTAGDFKVTAVLEWGSLKDTGTGVVVTQFVTSVDGIENFNNDTTLPTSAAVKLYVDTKFSQTDTLTEVLSFGNTTSGYDIAVSAGDDITFTDTSKILMGASSDLQIYHDGNNSYINDAGTGSLLIRGNNVVIGKYTGETLINAVADGRVDLYYDNSIKITTTNAGAEVTGDLVVTGTITGSGGSFLPLAGGAMTGATLHGDGVHSYWGNANDLQIDHDGNHSVFNSLTGNIYFSNEQNGGHIELRTDNGSGGVATYLKLNGANGAVELNHYGTKKFETTSTGVAVTGALSTTTNVSVGANATFVDNGKAIFGAGSDLQIYHDGSNSKIVDSGTGDLRLAGNVVRIRNAADTENMISAVQGAGVSLAFNNGTKFETLTDGAKVTGNLEVTGTITGSGGSFLPLAGGTMTGDTLHSDSVSSYYGTGNDLRIYHTGSTSYIQDIGTGSLIIDSSDLIIRVNGSENAIIANSNGAVDIYYNNVKKLATTNTGISVTGDGAFTGNITIPDNQQIQFGNSNDLRIQHASGGTSFIQNYTGQLNIDQAAVTQSIVFRVSDANALDTTALTISRNGDLTTGRDVTIAGDLTVNGTTTTVNSQTLSVVDPLISLAINNSANSLDIGYYGKYNDGTGRYLGLFSDASDGNKFKLFKGTTVEPTTTVDIGGAGYVAADLQVAGLEASNVSSVTGNFTGLLTIDSPNYAEQLTILRLSNGYKTIITGTRVDYSPVGTTDTFKFLANLQSTGNLTVTGTGISSISGQLNVGTNLLMNNNKEIRWLDSGGAERTVLELDSNDDLYLGKSGGGNLYLVNGTSYTTAVTIDNSQNAIFAGNVKAPFFTTDGGRGFKQDSVSFVGTYSDGSNADSANDLGSATNQWRDVYISGDITSSAGGATFAGNVALTTGSQLFFDNGNTYISEDIADRLRFFVGGSEFMRFTEDTADNINFYHNATFAGDVGLGGTGLYTNTASLNIDGTGLAIKNDTAGSSNNWSIIKNTATSSSSNIVFVTGAGTSLTLNNDKSATFAGNVAIQSTIPKLSFTDLQQDDWDIINDNGEFKFLCSTGSGVALQLNTNNNATFAGDVTVNGWIKGASDTNTLYSATGLGTLLQSPTNSGAGANIYFRNFNGTVFQTFSQEDGSATFAGSITANTTSTPTLIVGRDGTDGDAVQVYNGATGSTKSLAISVDGNDGTIYSQYGDIILQPSAGNVGIGTDSPTVGLQLGNSTSGETKTAIFNSEGGGEVGLTIKSRTNRAKLLVSDNDSNAYVVAEAGKAFFGTSASGDATNITVLTSGKVGIGTDSPESKLHIQTDAAPTDIYLTDGTLGTDNYGGVVRGFSVVGQGGRLQLGTLDNDIYYPALTILQQGGNVGIGTSTPYAKLNVNGDVRAENSSFMAGRESAAAPAFRFHDDDDTGIFNESPNVLGFSTAGAEAMRINGAGDVLIGTTGTPNGTSVYGSSFTSLSNGRMALKLASSSSTSIELVAFYNPNGKVGSITTNGSATAFNTSSDYRLKEDLKDFNGLEMVSSIPVYDHKWKVDDSRSYGVMAHELQEVLPQAVSGEKDAEEMQSVDYSKIVPVLLKAIQELTAKVETLEANACKCKN